MKLFSHEAQSGANPRLKAAFAKDVTPVLQQHMDEVQQLQQALPAATAER